MVLGICLLVFAYVLIAGPRLRALAIDRPAGGVGFWKYLKVGLPLAVTSTLVSAVWLWFVWG